MALVQAAKEELNKFLSKANLLKEQEFAKLFTEKLDISLSFEIGSGAYTDGKFIVADPNAQEIFADKQLLKEVTAFLKWPEDLRLKLVNSYWLSLKFITRAQTLHECLHILYTDFPPHGCKDPRCNSETKEQVMHYIENIIEDAYIENVGCSEYDNLSLFIDFGRVAVGLASLKDPDYYEKGKNLGLLEQYINEMIHRILYPFIPSRGYSEELEEYIQKTEPLFRNGTVSASPDKRYKYCQAIFDEIYPLFDKCSEDLNTDFLNQLLNDHSTHGEQEESDEESFGRSQSTEQRKPLGDKESNKKEDKQGKKSEDNPDFKSDGDSDGESSNQGEKSEENSGKGKSEDQQNTSIPERDDGLEEDGFTVNAKSKGVSKKQEQQNVKKQSSKMSQEFEDKLRLILDNYQKEFEELKNYNKWTENRIVLSGKEVSGKDLHQDTAINVTHPIATENDKELYARAYEMYRLNIQKYRRKFSQILKAYVEEREEKRLFGSGINARRFGDVKKRYWYRNLPEVSVPDMAVMLLIDGSGSMCGARSRAAMQAAIIMHEVLKGNEIPHAVVEHRALRSKSVDINVLYDFNSKDKEKYILAKIHGSGINKDGLALYWVGKYLDDSVFNESKLVIVLSDGAPSAYESYELGIKDTADAAKRLKKRNVDVIAIALEDKGETSTYEALKRIYKNVILCDDMNVLTQQVLDTISKILLNK